MHANRRTSGSRYHNTKSGLIGHNASNVPPAWRGPNAGPGPSSGSGGGGSRNAAGVPTGPRGGRSVAQQTQPGSKILMNKLPTDVGEAELEVGSLASCDGFFTLLLVCEG
jgi:hypothetical protein